MSIELIVPTLGESITEATVSRWLKKTGESFNIDEPLVEIETDKITVEVPAPKAGVLKEIKAIEGKDIKIGGILAIINESSETNTIIKNKKEIKKEDKNIIQKEESREKLVQGKDSLNKENLSPSVKKILKENKIDASEIRSYREDGRLVKSDVINYLEKSSIVNEQSSEEKEQIVPMSKIRKTIAQKLKNSQNTAAILTTFNEVDMSNIIKVRETKKEDFLERNKVKLGFMSFFVKATVKALKEFPAVNAEIRNENIIYKNHFDIGIAVGTEKGLVVPVLKDADKMTFAVIEKNILELGSRAKEGTLTMNDLSGGTFTISNGGVYGSMLSTPIINSPQSGILGMHNIIKRAVVINDEILIRPMMYLAFSYDHRIIDGKESVGFLIRIKELLENPSEIVLGI